MTVTPPRLWHPRSPSSSLSPSSPSAPSPWGAAGPLQAVGRLGGPWWGRNGGSTTATPAPQRWRHAERESAGLHSRARGLRRDLCGRKGAGETRLSRICLMQRFLHIPERLVPLRGSQAGRSGVASGVLGCLNNATPWGWGAGAHRWRGGEYFSCHGYKELHSPGWARQHQPRGRGLHWQQGWAALGALMARLAQTRSSVGRAGLAE